METWNGEGNPIPGYDEEGNELPGNETCNIGRGQSTA